MRVVLARLGLREIEDVDELSPFTYMVESASDRFGALDFQLSPTEYAGSACQRRRPASSL